MSTPQLSVYFFLQVGVIILACRAAGALARRIGQPQVVGEMIAGVALGPSLFGALAPGMQGALFPAASLDMLYVGGQVGVGLYMFLVGTEFNVAHLQARYRSALAVSWAGIAVPFALAFALAPWLHEVPGLFSPQARFLETALFLGAAIAITAFPMLARIIQERGLAGSPLGTLALTAGAMDDAAAWCILAVVLASFGGSWGQAWIAIIGGIVYLALMLSVGRRWLRPLANRVPLDGPLPAPTFAVVMALFFFCAWAMDAIGLHAVFGGFVLGICLPRGALTDRLRATLQTVVVVLLLPLFFTYSGLKTQLSLVFDAAMLLPAIAILLASFGGKAVACWAAARLAGETSRDAMAIGALMNARGLMELIIINIGLQAGLIGPSLFSILVVMAILTTLMATPLFNRIMRSASAAEAEPSAR
ncbi:cation:proton antiporter [Pseudoxanthomonas sp. LjRoot168]|uniref:cation:proton antiporter n=1 Tax=unclassified Pseudoxanthomonas TaxID=2645906 RepID=UPI003ED00911